MPSETKRQHFVPKTYLDKFGTNIRDRNYQVFAVDKQNFNNIFPINTTKVCVKKNIYTLDGDTEEERQLVENFYGDNVDARYNEFYDIITNDKIIEITTEQRRLIIEVMINLLFRTTKLPNIHNNLIRQVFERMFELCNAQQKDYFYFEKTKISIAGKTIDDLYNEYVKSTKEDLIYIQLKAANALIQERINDFISIIKLEENPKYITSDNPISLYNFRKKPIAPLDRSNEIILPVNDSYCLTLYPHQSSEINLLKRIKYSGVLNNSESFTNNFMQFGNCDRFLIGSKENLENFIELVK